jgi:hypothetical protein
MNTNKINKSLRFCKKCNQDLPKTIEFFPLRKTDKEGFGLYCKQCINREKREKRSELRKIWDKGGIVEGQDGRKCTICKNIYPETLEYFGKHKLNSKGLDTYCKICRRKKGRTNYEKNKEKWNITHNKTSNLKLQKIIEIKKQSNGCSKCKDKRWYLLDYHHLDPSIKLFQISQGESKGWDKIQLELEKCIPLCSNCHREFHFLEKTTGININNYLENHGN